MARIMSRQRSDVGRIWRAWLIAWLGGSVLGIVNGVVRELVYKDEVGDRTAHYISTATLIVLLALYFWMLDRRWPLPTFPDAILIGLVWALLTASFDFGFGHYVDRKPWSELAREYDLSAGRVWILALAWVALGPSAIRGIRRTKSRQP
jgi:hypothetical protein